MDPGESKILIVVFAFILMMGSVTMFIIGSGLLGNIDDPHKSTYTYTFEGMMDGAVCTGDGRTEYTPENVSSHLYTMYFTLRSSAEEKGFKIGLLFDSDDMPSSSLYEYMGETVIGEQVAKDWIHREKGMTYVISVVEHCKVLRITINADDMDVVGDIEG